MGSSTKKKNEKKKDFQKAKLKVGKARPKNTNATDTSFSAKSIVFKQQSLSQGTRDAAALFNHNLSLLSSSSDAQRRDALQYLTTACLATGKEGLPQSPSTIIAKTQALVLDKSTSVRSQLLKLYKALPSRELGPIDQLAMYIRAGMAHLANDTKLSSLDFLDWLLESNAEALLACPGGWVKSLKTFQNLLSWHGTPAGGTITNGKWTASKPATTNNLGSNKLLVHQLTTLARLLTAGLTPPSRDLDAAAKRAAGLFPLHQMDAHLLPARSNAFGYLNLFGAVRDVESEVYEDAEERVSVFVEAGLLEGFRQGAREAKREAGEVGRAASAVEKALKLVEGG